MITERIEYRGHFLTETIRRIDTSSEIVRLRRWEISYFDTFGVEVRAFDARDLTEAKQKVDTRLLTNQAPRL